MKKPVKINRLPFGYDIHTCHNSCWCRKDTIENLEDMKSLLLKTLMLLDQQIRAKQASEKDTIETDKE